MQLQKFVYLDIGVVSICALVCFVTATFTNQMVTGRVTHPDVNSTNYGEVQFGLVWGTKQYNYGYGQRPMEKYNVYDEYADISRIGLVLGALCSVCIACVFMVLSIGTAVIKAITGLAMVQTEGNAPKKGSDTASSTDSDASTATQQSTVQSGGFPWLLIWNGAAFGLGAIAIILYTSWFETQVKNSTEPNGEGFVIDKEDSPTVGYSFWLLVSGQVLILTNVAIVFIDWWKRRERPPKEVKEPEQAPPPGDVQVRKISSTESINKEPIGGSIVETES